MRTEPCDHCGKDVRIDRVHWRIDPDGQDFWYAIGPECRKKYPDAERWEPTGTLTISLEPGIGLPYHDTHAEKAGQR